MAADNEAVANWHSKQVISWFQGLDDGLQCYIPNLEEASITGAQLLALNYEDLNNLGIFPVGHQELVLEATELLKDLHFNLDTENLQSRALDLNCRCRSLRSSISSRRRNDTDATAALQRGSSIPLLRLACDVLDSCKLLVMWLDRPPFFSNPEARKVRAGIVKLSHELSTTVQQTVFACVIEDAVTSICSEIEVLSNQLIVSNDPMTIQPSSLEVAHLVNRDPSTGLGLFIKATFEGHHVITGTKEGSISSKIRRITPGDEVVAVGGQTVVGWQLSRLVAALKESPNDISITLKKRPHFSGSGAAATPTSRRQHQERILTVPPPISPIRKVADSRKNSVEDTVDGGISAASDLSRNDSQENLASPKKSAGKKKKKLKKQKANSSSNILATADESAKKSSNRSSVHSFGSLINESLQSASSSEAVLSVSTGNLSKKFDVRKSLDKVMRRERHDSAENHAHQPKHGKHHKKGRTDRSKQQEMMPNVNDILEELRTKRLKRHVDQKFVAGNENEIDKEAQEPMTGEPPSSPLDFLNIPPPPEAPYTPRVENVLQVLTDEASIPSSDNPTYSASESPNSLLDIEHQRRFTIIGSEQMDEKWFNSLLTEVDAKRSRRAKASARQILGRLDETTASEDSVFASRSLLAEGETPIKLRPPKPKRLNRPVSMPPNYYSPSKLNQYRTPQTPEGFHSSSLARVVRGETSPTKTSRISPVAHQMDDKGVKKLAPLNCSYESVISASNSFNANSSENRKSWSKEPSVLNANNNSNSAGRVSSLKGKYKTPPKPPRRSLSVTEKSGRSLQKSEPKMPTGRSAETGPHLQLDLKPVRPKSMSEEPYVGLLQVKPHGTSTPVEPVQEVKLYRSRTEISSEAPAPTKLAIANELNKYFLRKGGSSDSFSPTQIPSPTGAENDAFMPIAQTSPAKTPLMPPVAKPRTKLPTPVLKEPSLYSVPGKDTENLSHEAKKSRSKSVDNTEIVTTSTIESLTTTASTTEQAIRRKSEDLNVTERSSSRISRASPTSRGSYVAAMGGGFKFEKMLKEAQEDGYRRDSDGYAVKIVDGVKVRLRKSTGKSHSKKKARLKIVDQLKASSDMGSQRRISCRDLGAGECNGWLWKKKHSTSPLSSKWSKRWVVLKEGALYCYHTEEDESAESFISLPGYKVTPAPECKRKFAFRVAHILRKTFYFASDRQMDMSRWMNKMGLAAIEYRFTQSRDSTNKQGDISKDDQNYYSESDSEDTLSQSESGHNTLQSGTESSTPNSSPEKVIKPGTKPRYTMASNNQSGSRHMSTQPDLNRSARFPKNKAISIAQSRESSSSGTQTTDSLQRNAGKRSKSEAADSSKERNAELSASGSSASLSTQDDKNSRPRSTSPRKMPVITSGQSKPKAIDARRQQLLETGYLSTSLETIPATTLPGLRSSHSEEELQHLRKVTAKKAEEVAQRERSPSSSLVSNTPLEKLQAAANDEKMKAEGKKSPSKIVDNLHNDGTSDGARTPESLSPMEKNDDSSIDELCKALHDAELDIHGVNRRTTLRRRMTILSKDPRKNEFMLRKRALQRQIKALEGELQYYSLLDEESITSEKIHKWINQHPSLVADLGTIRRMSKRKKNVDKDNNDNLTTDLKDGIDSVPQNSKMVEKTISETTVDTAVRAPVPAKRGRAAAGGPLETKDSTENSHQRKHSDTDIPSTHSTLELNQSFQDGIPKARPRSCAFSTHDVDKMKPLNAINKLPSPSNDSLPPNFSPTRRPYLETDL